MTIAQFPTETTALRLKLRENGFHPLPAGTASSLPRPLPIRTPFMPDWFKTDEEDIRFWEKSHHTATSTAVAAKFAPALLIDSNIEAAAEAAEKVVREYFEKRGDIYVCLRWPTKRLILLRTDEPFAKLSRTLFSPNDDEHQVELLGDGQMYVVDGDADGHVGKPARWLGGDLKTIQYKNLPNTQHEDGKQVLDAIVKLWVEKFGLILENPTTRLQWMLNNCRKAEARVAARKAANPEPTPQTLQQIRKLIVGLKENNKKVSFTIDKVTHLLDRKTIVELLKENNKEPSFTVDDIMTVVDICCFDRIAEWRDRLRHEIGKIWAELNPDESSIPLDTLAALNDPSKDGLHQRFWNVMMVLKSRGYTVDGILALFVKYPNGIAARYRGRLRHEIERAFDKIRINPAPTTPEAAPSPVFDPWQRYIVPPFPLDILPPVVQDYVTSQAAVIGCDISGLAMCVLGTFSGALHHSFALRMQRHSNWYERPRLWLLNVADPSQRKTPTLKAATRPIVHYETHLRVKHERDLRDCAQASAQAQGQDHNSALRKPDPPPRYVVWDTSVEKLGELLAANPKGLLVLSDEFSFWLGSMERYSNSAGRSDRGFWLTAYDGGPHNIDRIRRGSLHIKNLSVSLLGCIQPDRLAEMQGLTSDGLLQRFVPVMWGPATFTQDRPCNDEAYAGLVRELIFAKPARLIIDDAALATMDDLRRHLFNIEQTSGGLAAGFQTWVGKLHGIAGSLALILHMAHDPQIGATYAVEEQTVKNVRRLILDFILPHGYEFYQQAGGSERLRQLASWILTSGKQRIVSSDITRNVADCRGLTLPQLQERLSPLVAGGWLEPETRTPSCNAWNVAPQVHTQLAERAKNEAERKAKLVALMRLAMTENPHDPL
jgi:hypothetical protein